MNMEPKQARDIVFSHGNGANTALRQLIARKGGKPQLTQLWWEYRDGHLAKRCGLCGQEFSGHVSDISELAEHGIQHLKQYNLLAFA